MFHTLKSVSNVRPEFANLKTSIVRDIKWNIKHFGSISKKPLCNISFNYLQNSVNSIQNKRVLIISVSSQRNLKQNSFISKRSFTSNDFTKIPNGKGDASGSVATVEVPTSLSIKELLLAYASLAKLRLGSLVIVSTMFGYLMAPAVHFDLTAFICSSFGTTLAVACANTFNQIIEIERDAKMHRTLKRILPTGKISTSHAAIFGLASGITGVSMLLLGVNNLAAGLAFSNIILYTCVYTPMKTMHPINTWVGSIVGAVPPMIGWASATGGLEAGAWTLGALLYIWQIPHFLALSWNLRHDYAKAGYKMLSNINPEKVPAATLRWSLYLLPVGALCSYTGITSWWFALDSLVVDSYMIYTSYKFYKENSSGNSRKAFKASLSYLPLFLMLMMLHKQSPLNPKNEKERIENSTSQ